MKTTISMRPQVALQILLSTLSRIFFLFYMCSIWLFLSLGELSNFFKILKKFGVVNKCYHLFGLCYKYFLFSKFRQTLIFYNINRIKWYCLNSKKKVHFSEVIEYCVFIHIFEISSDKLTKKKYLYFIKHYHFILKLIFF